jgi:hypothetical protein
MNRKKNLIEEDKGSKFQFLTKDQLLHNYIRVKYPDKFVVALLNSKEAFSEEVQLITLKRDNLKSYLKGITNDITLVVFDVYEEALDYSYNFSAATEMMLFINGEIKE